MIKGHVCIDLHNHKSGFTERIEGDNTITPAFQNLLNRFIVAGNNVGSFSPIATTVLGGLYILDTELDNDIYVPSTAKILGSGFSGQNSATDIIGSYNTLESGRNGNDYVHVWDFATTQSNGQIKSLALVHSTAGKFPFYAPFLYLGNAVSPSGDHGGILYYDEVNEDVYFCYAQSGGSDIYKSHLPLMTLDIFRSSNGINPIENTGKRFNHYWNNPVLDGNDGFVYYQEESGITLKLYPVKVSDLSFDEGNSYTVTLPSGSGSIEQVALNVTEDVIYVTTYSPYKLYKIKYSTKEVTEISGVNTYSSYLHLTKDGDLYIGNRDNGGTSYRITSNGDIQSCINIGSSYDNNCNIRLSSGMKIVNNLNHSLAFDMSCLMTNYNLPSVIEKNVSQSMKVTYTLTQQ